MRRNTTQSRKASLNLLRLESRLAPAVYTWVGLGDTDSFEDASNWSDGSIIPSVPGAGDDAFIDATFAADTISTLASHTLNSLTCDAGSLLIQVGTFEVTGPTKADIAHLTIGSGGTFILTNNLICDDVNVISGGTLDVKTATTLKTLDLRDTGAVTGAGDLTIDGSFTTAGGALGVNSGVKLLAGGKLILAVGAMGDVQGDVVLGRVFDNFGAVTGAPSVGTMGWYFGPSSMEPGTINNMAGATFTVNGEAHLYFSTSGANSFNNFGTFTHNAGGYAGLDAVFSVPVFNAGTVNNTGNKISFLTASSSGTINVTGGTLWINGTSDTSGPISISSGASVEVRNSSTFTFNAGAAVTGAGAVRVTAGKLAVAASTTASNIELTANSANQLNGPGDLTVSGNFTWLGGSLRAGGKLILPAGSTGQLTGNLVIGRVLENHGTVTRSNSGSGLSKLYFGAATGEPGIINNMVGAMFTVAGNGQFEANFPVFTTGNGINNAGTLLFAGPATATSSYSSTSIKIPIDNTGTMSVTSFTQLTNSPVTNSGTVTVTGALLKILGSYVQTAGTTTVDGALETFGTDFKGGIARGTGTLVSKTTNAGIVSPGLSPGNLTIFGNYSQTGTLEIELNGTTPGTLYDQLTVNGTVTLGGSLTGSVGYAPAPGASFTIIANDGTDAVVGTFAGLAEGAVTTIGGKAFAISYKGGTGNDVTLTLRPVTVQSVVINGGDIQRSRVNSVAINFDQHLTVSFSLADAFVLTRQSDSKLPTLVTSVDDSGATTVVTLTFLGTNAVDYGSLADGRYTLTIDASKVSNDNGLLDGNGNGVGGDDYTRVGTPVNGLFRLFGDANGDGTVAASDFVQFRLALGGSTAMFDFDGDGAVAASDFIQFRLRFGGSI